MRSLAFSTSCFLVCYVLYEVKMEVIVLDDPPYISGCSGEVTLSASEHNYEVLVHSNLFANQERKMNQRRGIRAKHPESKKRLKFELATLSGNCCWKVWNRYRGGNSFDMAEAEIYEPGWLIRSVELVDNCNLD